MSLPATFTQGRSSVPVGVSSWKLPCSALSSSSRWDNYHGACYGRLNNVKRGRKRGGWSAKRNDKKQWIQVRPHSMLCVVRGKWDRPVVQFWTSFFLGLRCAPRDEAPRGHIFPAWGVEPGAQRRANNNDNNNQHLKTI